MSVIIRRLVGVYHADGGIRGELAYAIGKLRGAAHCGLCDVTHRGVRAKPEWTGLITRLAVPFTLVHLNERSEPVAAASAGRTPCVLAETDDGLILLLGPDQLDRVGGDVSRFAEALVDAARAAGLALPQLNR